MGRGGGGGNWKIKWVGYFVFCLFYMLYRTNYWIPVSREICVQEYVQPYIKPIAISFCIISIGDKKITSYINKKNTPNIFNTGL